MKPASISYTFPVVDEHTRAFTIQWQGYFRGLEQELDDITSSGPTTSRPTTRLFIGRPYFDTTLTKPIWVKQLSPTVLWCDATGATV